MGGADVGVEAVRRLDKNRLLLKIRARGSTSYSQT